MSRTPLLDGEDFEYMYELYHKNLISFVSETALAPERSGTKRPPDSASKTYRRTETVSLAGPDRSAVPPALQDRASYTEPRERRPLTETELATLLAYAYGEIRESEEGAARRPVPSGGGCYPLEIYPIVVDSPDVDAGIYHYNVDDDALDRLQAGDYSEWIQDNWTWVGADDTVSAVIVITAFPERSARRYGELGYLFAGIEAGAVIQNLQLVATELGVGSRPHNGLNYRALRQQLRLGDDEYLLSTVVFAGTAPGSSE